MGRICLKLDDKYEERLRKELRIVTGALVKIMEANGLTVEEMKKAGKEFYRERF